MKTVKAALIIITLLLSFNLYAQSKSPYRYKVVVDLGSDLSDPLFSSFSLKDYIVEKMSKSLPEFRFSDSYDANVILNLTLLTEKNELVNNQYVSALNLLVTSFLHNPLNWNVLLIEKQDENAKEKIRDYIDKWILKYALFIYKSNKLN